MTPEEQRLRETLATLPDGLWNTSGAGVRGETSVRKGDRDDPNADNELVASCCAYEHPARDAAFIAAARNAVPAVLTEIDRLRTIEAAAIALREQARSAARGEWQSAIGLTEKLFAALDRKGE